KVQLNDGNVSAMRTGFGGIAATPARAPQTEQALLGQHWTEGSVTAAEAVLKNEFTPLTDMRATDDYRRLTTARLLRKFFIETSDPEAHTRVLEEAVWS